MFAIPENEELPFLDGSRLVPDYIGVMLSGIDTQRYTYDQAIKLANENVLGQQLGKARERLIRDHFTEVRDGDR